MHAAQEAIEILQGALSLADFLEKEEREQVLRRIQQLQQRVDEHRIHIAFVGEKKAGKSSLLKALTGVPLPTAVRECTAAVCLIQLGLDWHHMADLENGEKRNFEALDDSSQHRLLRLARKKDKLAAENAVENINKAEQAHQKAEELLAQLQQQENDCQEKLRQHQENVVEQEKNLPFLWNVWKNFSWFASVQQIQGKLDQEKASIRQSEQDLEDLQHKRAEQELRTTHLASLIPEKWKDAKEAASITRTEVENAKLELQKISKANQEKFNTELHDLIDLDREPAEKVEILTPNISIPANVVLIDTPGFNTDLPQHRRRAWEAIEELADICILVSDIRQPMPETSLQMLRRIGPFCPFMHLALTKSDLALEEADILQENPEQEILEAKQVAKNRVSPYWDGDMNIWVVASEGQERKKAQTLFTEFWDSIPKQAPLIKTKKLGANAIAEFVDLLDIHMLIAQENLKEFDLTAAEILQHVLHKLQTLSVDIPTISTKTMEIVSTQGEKYLCRLEEHWIAQIQNCKTKSDIKQVLEQIQQEMATKSTELARVTQQLLEMHTQQIAKDLFDQKSMDLSKIQSTMEQILQTAPKTDAVSTNTALLVATVAGVAGMTTGLLLQQSLVIPLLLVLGGGGITNLLISPLNEGKETAVTAITNSVQEGKLQWKTKIDSLPSLIQKEIGKHLQDYIQAKEEEERAHQRQIQVRHIQRIQDIQKTLEKSKIAFLLNA